MKHALTYFKRVRLPGTALLGGHDKAEDDRTMFFRSIFRVISGTLSMGGYGVASHAIMANVAGRYSLRRTVTDTSTGQSRAIATFPTQHGPILAALATVFVFREFSQLAHSLFTARTSNVSTKHFIAAVYKITVMKYNHEDSITLADRCGAQGLFEVNQISITNVRLNLIGMTL